MRLSEFDENAPVGSLKALASLALSALRKRGEFSTVRAMCSGEIALANEAEKGARNK